MLATSAGMMVRVAATAGAAEETVTAPAATMTDVAAETSRSGRAASKAVAATEMVDPVT